MPTYEYKCRSCQKTFEKFQSMTDPALTECPSCRGIIERIISTGSGIIFKGAGFHCNDYPNSQSGNSRCGRETPCCGRESFCGNLKCDT